MSRFAYHQLLAVFLILLLAGCSRAMAQEPTAAQSTRPINFIFLIDVSGSMLSKRTMVTGADGKQITLFEALRDALRDIVNDERVVPPDSKVSFITFGTAVEHKSDWPDSIASPDDRKKLVAHITNPAELQADKHGDTYMAGALDSAYTRIEEVTRGADPCATTFVVMMTDGWDEPPAGAKLKVKNVAQTFVQKEHALSDKLGVNTLLVRVIGLQRLPDRKAGTTTAKELATILGGEFMDVSTTGASTVSNRIFHAVQKTIADLKAKIDIADAHSGGLADFGEVNSSQATAAVKVSSRSCYPEQITGLTDETGHLTPDVKSRISGSVRQNAGSANNDQLLWTSTLPANAIKVHLQDSQYTLAPAFKQKTANDGWQQIQLVVDVDSQCRPGNYCGAVRLLSSAMVPELVAYCVAVPSRILFDSQDRRQVSIRKPGFFFPKATSISLPISVNAQVGKKVHGETKVSFTPQPAQLVQEKEKGQAGTTGSSESSSTIAATQINDGKAADVVLNAGDSTKMISIPIAIPADQRPGLYQGKLPVHIDGDPTLKTVDGIAFSVRVLPSAWEEISPVAIPLMALLALMLVIGFILTVARLRR